MKKFAGILLMLLLLCGAALAENTYHVEEFPIEKEDESVIAGWLYVPDGAENAPAVILCHGFNGTHRNMDGYAEYLAQRGYVCYTFDFCGGGTQSQSSGATADMTLLTELDDLDAALHAGPRFDECLAVLARDHLRDLLEVAEHEFAELVEHADALDDGRFIPRRPRRMRGFDGLCGFRSKFTCWRTRS